MIGEVSIWPSAETVRAIGDVLTALSMGWGKWVVVGMIALWIVSKFWRKQR